MNNTKTLWPLIKGPQSFIYISGHKNSKFFLSQIENYIKRDTWPISQNQLEMYLQNGLSDQSIANFYNVGSWRVQSLRKKYHLEPCSIDDRFRRHSIQILGPEKKPKLLISPQFMDRLYKGRKYI